jgi:hypothetical protein
MNAGEIVFESGCLKLVRDNEPGFGCLTHGGKALLRFLLHPRNPIASPLVVAKAIVGALQPQPPQLDLDRKSGEWIGGLYYGGRDTIYLYGRQRLLGHEVFSIVAHEAAHATGHSSRLARGFWRNPGDGSEDPDTSACSGIAFAEQTPELQLEELTASIGGMIICLSMSVPPAGSARWFRWIALASIMPPETVTSAIRDGLRSAAFVLHNGNAESRLWCAEMRG